MFSHFNEIFTKWYFHALLKNWFLDFCKWFPPSFEILCKKWNKLFINQFDVIVPKSTNSMKLKAYIVFKIPFQWQNWFHVKSELRHISVIFALWKFLPKSCHGNGRKPLCTFPEHWEQGFGEVQTVPGWSLFCNFVLDMQFWHLCFCKSKGNCRGISRIFVRVGHFE